MQIDLSSSSSIKQPRWEEAARQQRKGCSVSRIFKQRVGILQDIVDANAAYHANVTVELLGNVGAGLEGYCVVHSIVFASIGDGLGVNGNIDGAALIFGAAIWRTRAWAASRTVCWWRTKRSLSAFATCSCRFLVAVVAAGMTAFGAACVFAWEVVADSCRRHYCVLILMRLGWQVWAL